MGFEREHGGKSEETPGQEKAIEAKTLTAKSPQYLPRHFSSTDPVLEEVMSIFKPPASVTKNAGGKGKKPWCPYGRQFVFIYGPRGRSQLANSAWQCEEREHLAKGLLQPPVMSTKPFSIP